MLASASLLTEVGSRSLIPRVEIDVLDRISSLRKIKYHVLRGNGFTYVEAGDIDSTFFLSSVIMTIMPAFTRVLQYCLQVQSYNLSCLLLLSWDYLYVI